MFNKADTAHVAGALVIGAVILLGVMRHTFSGVTVKLG